MREIWIVTIRVMPLIITAPWGEFYSTNVHCVCVCMCVCTVYRETLTKGKFDESGSNCQIKPINIKL